MIAMLPRNIGVCASLSVVALFAVWLVWWCWEGHRLDVEQRRKSD